MLYMISNQKLGFQDTLVDYRHELVLLNLLIILSQYNYYFSGILYRLGEQRIINLI